MPSDSLKFLLMPSDDSDSLGIYRHLVMILTIHMSSISINDTDSLKCLLMTSDDSDSLRFLLMSSDDNDRLGIY